MDKKRKSPLKTNFLLKKELKFSKKKSSIKDRLESVTKRFMNQF